MIYVDDDNDPDQPAESSFVTPHLELRVNTYDEKHDPEMDPERQGTIFMRDGYYGPDIHLAADGLDPDYQPVLRIERRPGVWVVMLQRWSGGDEDYIVQFPDDRAAPLVIEGNGPCISPVEIRDIVKA